MMGWVNEPPESAAGTSGKKDHTLFCSQCDDNHGQRPRKNVVLL